MGDEFKSVFINILLILTLDYGKTWSFSFLLNLNYPWLQYRPKRGGGEKEKKKGFFSLHLIGQFVVEVLLFERMRNKR